MHSAVEAIEYPFSIIREDFVSVPGNVETDAAEFAFQLLSFSRYDETIFPCADESELGCGSRRCLAVAGDEQTEHLGFEIGKGERVDPVIQKRFPCRGTPARDDFVADGASVVSDLRLGMIVHTQLEKVQQVVQIDFPECFRIGGKWQVLAGLLACDTRLDSLFVDRPGTFLQLFFLFRKMLAGGGVEITFAALPIATGLQPPFGGAVCWAESMATE